MSNEKNGVGAAGGGALRTRFCRQKDGGWSCNFREGNAGKDDLPTTDSVQGQQGLRSPRSSTEVKNKDIRSQVRTGENRRMDGSVRVERCPVG